MLPHPSLPEGYTLRPPERSDLAAVAALKQAVDRSWHLKTAATGSDVSESDVSEEWALPRLDAERDIWIIEDADGRLAGYGLCWMENPPREVVAEQTVDPEVRGRGLSSALLELGEARAAEHARKTPDGSPVLLGVWTHESDTGRRDLFARYGYRQVRSFLRLDRDLTLPLPDPVWPAGITVLAFRRDRDEAAVHAATEEAFQDHFRPSLMDLDEWLEYRSSRPEIDDGLWFVVWDGDDVAGGVLAFPAPAGAYIDELFVRRPWRGRGLGRALLLHELAEVRRRGFTMAYLGVDADNPTGAHQLYRSLGFEPRRGAMLFFEKEVSGG